MTCFAERGINVNNTGTNFGMGANGSSIPSGINQGSSSGGRGGLKGRSQSTFALHTNKSPNNNGTPNSSHRNYSKGPHKEECEYYDIKDYNPSNTGLSSSIPADLWDLPPNSQSYSPSRYRRKLGSRVTSEGDNVQRTRKNRFLQMPVLEALINLSKKGGRGRVVGRNGGAEPPDKISSRAKLYAASCPDVTQHTNENIINYGGSHIIGNYDESDNVRGSQPILYGDALGNSRRNSEINGSQSTIASNQCHRTRRQKSWTEDGRRGSQNNENRDGSIVFNRHQSAMSLESPYPAFPFICEDAIFQVALQRDHRGLGLGFSVSGGADSQEPFAGLIRVKKVFPLGPAFQSGQIQPWDIILKANGISLIGLTNHEALEVLRTTPTDTLLTLCRPPPLPEIVRTSGGAHMPGFGGSVSHIPHINHYQQPPCPLHPHGLGGSISTECEGQGGQSLDNSFTSIPSLPSFKSKSLSSLHPKQNTDSIGEFEIILEKICGSLGFTIRQDDGGRLGHYVRELVKPPALGDGRIQPGDRIISVNSEDLEGMSHADAVRFLRQCPACVKLRLYRDPCQTPISNLSPPENHRIIVKDKTYRQEAIDMIHEMKERKHLSSSPEAKGSFGKSTENSQGNTTLQRGYKQSPVDTNAASTLPRKRPGLQGITPSPEVISAALDRFAGRTTPKSSESPDLCRLKPKIIGSGTPKPATTKSCPLEARSSGSGESTPAGTIINQNRKSEAGKTSTQEGNSKNENSENIGGRKASFRQYTMHLDRISSLEDDSFSDLNLNDSIASVPGSYGGPSDGNNFSAGQPRYQSAVFPASATPRLKLGGNRKNLSLSREEVEQYGHEWRSGQTGRLIHIDEPISRASDGHDSGDYGGNPCSTAQQNGGVGGGGLTKWKGLQFPSDDEEEDEDDEDNLNSLDGSLAERGPVIGESDQNPASFNKTSTFLTVDKLTKLSQRQSPDGREFHEGEINMIEVSNSQIFSDGQEIITVQLSRKWCSRLGFSIKGSQGHTFITAIYEDSVAGRDGRLQVGDELIMVNNESIRNMETAGVIDLMRKTRGVITITLLRKHATEETDSPLGLT